MVYEAEDPEKPRLTGEQIFMLILLGFAIGLFTAAVIEPYPCNAGEQKTCITPSGNAGVKYCKKSGFGWEPCQAINGTVYPQALWRQR